MLQIYKKPKIAFCFSWQARTLDQTYIFFQKNLFDAAKDQWYDYDIFCVVEDDEDVDKVKLLNPTKIEKIKSSNVKKIIDNKYWYFLDNEIFKYCDFIHTWIYSVLQQVYKVQSSIRLIWENQYDIILRLRFDIIYLNKFNFSKIKEDTKNGDIICNYSYNHTWFYFKKIISYADYEDIIYIWNNNMRTVCSNLFDDFINIITSLWSHKTNKREKFYLMLKKITTISNDINKKHHIIPITLVYYLKNIIWIKILLWESYYYLFFQYHKQKLKPTKISKIILREKIRESQIQLYEKSVYEI